MLNVKQCKTSKCNTYSSLLPVQTANGFCTRFVAPNRIYFTAAVILLKLTLYRIYTQVIIQF